MKKSIATLTVNKISNDNGVETLGFKRLHHLPANFRAGMMKAFAIKCYAETTDRAMASQKSLTFVATTSAFFGKLSESEFYNYLTTH